MLGSDVLQRSVDGGFGFTTEALIHNVEDDRHIWRADNGATDHNDI